MKTVQASYDSTLTDVLASHTAEYREIIEARVNASWRAAWDEKEAFVQKLENGLVASTRRIAELETQIVDAKLFRASEHADRVAAEKRVVALEVQIRHERIDCDAWRTWARLLTGFAEGSTDGGMRSGVDSKIAELDVDRKSAWKSYHTAADERDTLCARLVSANEQLASTVALNHDWTVWAQELTGLVGVGGVAYREAIGARLADDFDWPAWVRKVIGFDNMPANRAREMIQEAVHECHEYTRWINNLQVDEICAGESFASARAKVGKLVEAVRAAKPVLTAEERRDVEYIRECAKADPTFWRHAAKLVPIFDRLCPPPKAPPSDAELADMLKTARERFGYTAIDDPGMLKQVEDALRARGAK